MTAADCTGPSAPTINVLPAEVNADIAGRSGRPLRRRQRPHTAPICMARLKLAGESADHTQNVSGR